MGTMDIENEAEKVISLLRELERYINALRVIERRIYDVLGQLDEKFRPTEWRLSERERILRELRPDIFELEELLSSVAESVGLPLHHRIRDWLLCANPSAYWTKTTSRREAVKLFEKIFWALRERLGDPHELCRGNCEYNWILRRAVWNVGGAQVKLAVYVGYIVRACYLDMSLDISDIASSLEPYLLKTRVTAIVKRVNTKIRAVLELLDP